MAPKDKNKFCEPSSKPARLKKKIKKKNYSLAEEGSGLNVKYIAYILAWGGSGLNIKNVGHSLV